MAIYKKIKTETYTLTQKQLRALILTVLFGSDGDDGIFCTEFHGKYRFDDFFNEPYTGLKTILEKCGIETENEELRKHLEWVLKHLEKVQLEYRDCEYTRTHKHKGHLLLKLEPISWVKYRNL